MNTPHKKIFLSHSSADVALATEVRNLLIIGCGVSTNDILVSSVPGNGIPAGTPSFVDYLKARLQNAEIVVLLLSENFFASQYCLCELGATWLLGKPYFPLVVSPLSKSELGSTLEVTQAGEINNGRYLDQLPDKIRETVGTGVGTDAWGLQRDVFLAGLGELIKSLPAPKLVSADKLGEAQNKYQGAIAKIGEKEKEAALLKQQIADLEKCKDKDEGNAVARKYSTTQEQFEKLVQNAKGALERVKQITAAALFAEQGDHPCFPADGDWPEAMNALEIQEIKREMDRVYPRLEHIRVSRAQAALQELDEFLKSEVNAEFLFKLEQDLEFPPNVANKEFWHRYLRYV